MDITPQVINDVEFHQKMRGYDPDEVDDFLERVAVAVGQLQDRLREAAERLDAPDRRPTDTPAAAPAAEAAPAGVPDPSYDPEEGAETMRRTLVLAQRTADAAVKEAKEEAARTVQAAHERAEQQVGEAQQRARELLEKAEVEARKAGEDTRQRLVEEIIELEEARDSLRADNGILERHLEEQRLRLRSSVAELQRLLDDPARLRAAAVPPLSEVSRPAAVVEATQATEPPVPAPVAPAEPAVEPLGQGAPDTPGPAVEPEPEPAPAPAPSRGSLFGRPTPEPEAPDAPEPVPTAASDDASDEIMIASFVKGSAATGQVIDLAEAGPGTGGVTFTPSDDSGDLPLFAPTTPNEDEAWARFVGDDDPSVSGSTAVVGAGRNTGSQRAVGQTTQPVPVVGDDDAYLTELRKAMVDEHGGYADDELGDDPFDLDGRSRLRFGRRR